MPDASSLMTMQQIRHIYNLQKANVTTDYDPTATYDIGDLCIYLGVMYRCISTISTAENFDSTHWVSTNIDSELDRIESSVYSKSQTYSKSEAVAKADIVNNLYSTSTTEPLSANMGKILYDNMAAYSFGSRTKTQLETAINEGLSGKDNGYYRFVVVNITAATTPFGATNYVGWISVNTTNRYTALMFDQSANAVIHGSYNGSAWNWDKLITTSSIVDNLTSSATNAPLSANMGKFLHNDTSQAMARGADVDVDTLYGENLRVAFYVAGYRSQHLPTSAWYFILSFRAESTYISQLAIGMTESGVYYRKFSIGTVGEAWTKLG